MDGKALAERLRAEVAEEVRQLGDVGLATVLVGDDPASDIYIRRKHDAAQEVGIRSIDHRLPARRREEELLALVAELNADDGVDGILVQLPLPDAPRRGAAVRRASTRSKDVDGFHPENAGPPLPRRADASCRRRRSGSCGCSRSTACRSRARGRWSSAGAMIVGKPVVACSSCSERDRDDLPLAHARISAATRARRTSSSSPWAGRAW